jgi:beta-glucanase (GH16 family)
VISFSPYIKQARQKETKIRSAATLALLAFGIWLASLNHAGGQLPWSDEFDGTSLDPSHWTFDIGTGPPYPGWGNNELEYYTSRPQNVYVTNGLLHIVALQESYNGSSYTSAKLKTRGFFYQKYGRFEFRARLPQGQGYWSALWLLPEDSVYGGWAASGEIDLMENKGSNPTNVLGTLHFGGMYPNQAQSYGPSFIFPPGGSVTNFHIYALEWSSNAISWYVDNQLYQTQTSWWSSSNPTNTSIRNPYPAPFDQPFYILMNVAIGGTFPGNPDGTTVFPGEMQVDYVRVYNLLPPPLPALKLRLAFDDPPGASTSASDTNNGAVPVTLLMLNSAAARADYHGVANSGVSGAFLGGRALDFSSNASQPGQPGPVAAATNENLGFGLVSNFVVSLWFKQDALMSGNIGPRLFLLGAGSPADTGVTNSIGFKFQTASEIYFQLGSVTASATFPTNLPANSWLFLAAAYDGANISVYLGSETTSAALISSTSAITNVNFGTSGALYIGNRQNLQRSFDGWIDDFRFYTGIGDASFVETVRLQAITPPAIAIQRFGASLTLTWAAGTLQSATNLAGEWSDLSGVASPYSTAPVVPQQFYRLKLP